MTRGTQANRPCKLLDGPDNANRHHKTHHIRCKCTIAIQQRNTYIRNHPANIGTTTRQPRPNAEFENNTDPNIPKDHRRTPLFKSFVKPTHIWIISSAKMSSPHAVAKYCLYDSRHNKGIVPTSHILPQEDASAYRAAPGRAGNMTRRAVS